MTPVEAGIRAEIEQREALADFIHVCKCWPMQAVNGEAGSVAKWCGWQQEVATTKLATMERLGLMKAHRFADAPDLAFWSPPPSPSALMVIEDHVLNMLGITRASRNDEARTVTYNGPPVEEIESAIRFRGWSFDGYKLVCLGPDPTAEQAE